MRRRAFTLVELLVVMAILAILFSLVLPMARSARAAAFKSVAGGQLKQLSLAAGMYASDFDEQHMPAMYLRDGWLQTWFGLARAEGGYDLQQGLLRGYMGSRRLKDSTHQGQPYLGDGSGYGYNWGFIGSDMHVTGMYGFFPVCQNPARLSELADPSRTFAFGTSAYYHAAWLGGDGRVYDFGFIDPPFRWHGNPNLDFRHLDGTRRVDENARKVSQLGHGLAITAGGTLRTIKQAQTRDAMFARNPDL